MSTHDTPEVEGRMGLSEGGNGIGLLAQIMGLIAQLGERVGLIEARVADHDPRIITVEQAIARIDLHLSEHRTEVGRRFDEMSGQMKESIKQNRVYQSQVTSLDDHRKDHATAIEAKVDVLLAERDERARQAEESKARQIAARRAADAAEAAALKGRQDTLNSLGRLTLLVLPILINLTVNGTTVPHVVKQGTTLAMGVLVVVYLLYVVWSFARPPRRPPQLPPPDVTP